MRTHNTSRHTGDRMESAFLHTDSRTLELRSIQLLNSSARAAQHRSSIRRTREPPVLPNGKAELLADIEGLPVLVRLLVQNVPAEMQSDALYGGDDINLRLSSALERMVERMHGSPLRPRPPARHSSDRRVGRRLGCGMAGTRPSAQKRLSAWRAACTAGRGWRLLGTISTGRC